MPSVILKILESNYLCLFRLSRQSRHTFFNPHNTFRHIEELPCSELEHITQGRHSRAALVKQYPSFHYLLPIASSHYWLCSFSVTSGS